MAPIISLDVRGVRGGGRSSALLAGFKKKKSLFRASFSVRGCPCFSMQVCTAKEVTRSSAWRTQVSANDSWTHAANIDRLDLTWPAVTVMQQNTVLRHFQQYSIGMCFTLFYTHTHTRCNICWLDNAILSTIIKWRHFITLFFFVYLQINLLNVGFGGDSISVYGVPGEEELSMCWFHSDLLRMLGYIYIFLKNIIKMSCFYFIWSHF